jgi:hypothetical protein
MSTIDLALRDLPDEQLVAHVKTLVEQERSATAALIAALAEMAARRLYLPLGYSSLHQYCVEALHLSGDAAADRIEAARAALKYPVILERLADGSITLSALRMLIPSLTNENHRELLESARHKSKREVTAMVAALRPHTLPYRTVITPVSGEEFRIQVTVSRETHDKFRRAQDLLKHAVPDGDAAAILDRALSLLIKDLERKKAAIVAHPRASRPRMPGSRTVPAAVRRAVWARDDGRCAFGGTDGRCMATGNVQFHHVFPFCEDGPPTVDNVELRCPAHNRFEWDSFMADTELELAAEDSLLADPTGPGTSSERRDVGSPPAQDRVARVDDQDRTQPEAADGGDQHDPPQVRNDDRHEQGKCDEAQASDAAHGNSADVDVAASVSGGHSASPKEYS